MRSSPTTISFYPANPVASIAIYINDATLWVVGATTNLVLTPTASTTTYAAGTSIPLVAVAAPGVPVATVSTTNITLNSI